jgi:exosortase/archaeosortase family protein
MARDLPFGVQLTAEQQRLWDTFLFLAKVLVLSLPLYFVILSGVNLSGLQMLDATVASSILRSVGFPVLQNGALITAGDPPFTFYLTEDCTAWKSGLFLFALVFAVPAVTMRKRLIALGLGVPIIWLGNQARIIGVVLTERATNVQFAMFTHDFFWRAFLVFLVLGIWLLWIKRPPEMPFTQNHHANKQKTHGRLTRRARR